MVFSGQQPKSEEIGNKIFTEMSIAIGETIRYNRTDNR